MLLIILYFKPYSLIKFLMFETIPNDLLMSLYMDLQKHGSDEIKEMTRDKKLANKLLSRTWSIEGYVKSGKKIGRKLKLLSFF